MTTTAYPVSKPVWTFLAEANRWLHVPQHIIHVRVLDATAAAKYITPRHLTGP